MNKKEINKNLQHGYIFLGSIVLICFISSLALEMYLKGNFPSIHLGEQEPTEKSEEEKKEEGFILKLENIENGYETTDESVTIVGTTQAEAEIKINEKTVSINDQYRFEKKVDLIVGKNILVVQGYLDSKLQKEITFEIYRKEKEKAKPSTDNKQTDTTTEQKKETPKTSLSPTPDPTPTPTPTPSPITGLKMSCSINNTYPSAGQSVTISCVVTDQNSKAVQGATGFTSIGWQTGSILYNLSSSSSSGSMSLNFTVPAGNQGSINGTIKVTKSGLTVTSSFTLNIQ